MNSAHTESDCRLATGDCRSCRRLREERDEAREEVRQLRAQLCGGDPLAAFLSLGLTRSEARIVSVLNARAIATREAMRLALYSDDAGDGAKTENVFDVFVHQLRRKLAPRGIVIETVRGVGWRLPPASRAALNAAVARWRPA